SGQSGTLVFMCYVLNRALAVVCSGLILTASGSGQKHGATDFSGSDALTLTRRAVAFGPRPDGSPAIEKLRGFIRNYLGARGCEILEDRFVASTPDGPLPMENIIAKFPGKSGRAIAVTGHYDTKRLANFVGANDGGSSTGFLLEMAAVLQNRPRLDDIYLVFFDGEEARRDWTADDSVYGSRHLADKWASDGTNARLKGLINIDMIGDRNLKLVWDTGSEASLRDLVWDAADSLGYREFFPREGGPIEDDHLPFLNAGVRALDVIDFESQGTFWHKPQDTMDKLSAHSFEVVGNVVVQSVEELEKQK
ncbi:MAG TPA: M28 family peptidase, partial [Bryobacteraceae bacterium]|nr:M28 family peptidase [Bryobacteraceae bacterium]